MFDLIFAFFFFLLFVFRPYRFYIPMYPTASGPMIEIYQSSTKWMSFAPLTTNRFLSLISTFHSRNYISSQIANYLQSLHPNIQVKGATMYVPCTFLVKRQHPPVNQETKNARSRDKNQMTDDASGDSLYVSNQMPPEVEKPLFIWHERIPFTIKVDTKLAFILGNSFFEKHKLVLDFGESRVGVSEPSNNNQQRLTAPRLLLLASTDATSANGRTTTNHESKQQQETVSSQYGVLINWRVILCFISLTSISTAIILRPSVTALWNTVRHYFNPSSLTTMNEKRRMPQVSIENLRDWGRKTYGTASDFIISLYKNQIHSEDVPPT